MGMSQADIRQKYNVGAGALGNKIKRDGWRLSQPQTTALSEFKEASVKISESFHNANEIQKKEMVDRVQTILEDNYLIQNNRKIAKMFQEQMVDAVKNGEYSNPKSIKAGTSALRDIESIANPQPSKTEVNVQNNTVNTNTKWSLID